MKRLGTLEAGLRRTMAAIPPTSGAVVMGTTILSIALLLDNLQTLSRALLAVAGGVWLTLAALLIGRVAHDRQHLHDQMRSPAAFADVAGTSVLGTRLTLLGWDRAGLALLVIALILWVALLKPVLSHWVTPTVGVSLLLTVATESIAVLMATLARTEHADWLVYAALVPFVLGLVFYALIITRFDIHQLWLGRGDHWITGGALAISALAAGQITIAVRALALLGRGDGALKDVTVLLWVLTVLWLPVLLLEEATHPRLQYDVRRWATVFPVGMYAACSFVVGRAVGVPTITSLARVWIWAAVALWLIVFAAMVARGPRVAAAK